jgi:hypothetical protein
MKIGRGMAFKPKPIVHFEELLKDSGRTFIIVKPCGFYNQGFHCMEVAVTSCEHTFHPFYLGVMLKENVVYAMSHFILISRQVGDLGTR